MKFFLSCWGILKLLCFKGFFFEKLVFFRKLVCIILFREILLSCKCNNISFDNLVLWQILLYIYLQCLFRKHFSLILWGTLNVTTVAWQSSRCVFISSSTNWWKNKFCQLGLIFGEKLRMAIYRFSVTLLQMIEKKSQK